MMELEDFFITLAYFSIPVQILISLYQFPSLAVMPQRILVLCVLFALFISLCGAGHLLRALGWTAGVTFRVLNYATAFVSLATAGYLWPLLPVLFNTLEHIIQDAKEKEETEEAKNRKLMTFMGFLCHEIRNPLFAITANISFLGDSSDELNEDQNLSLRCIGQSTNLMLRLVNDVLDISRLDSGKVEIEKQAFDFHEMIHEVSSSIGSFIRARHPSSTVSFDYRMEEDVPSIVVGDAARLLQIIYNLLSNAAKFTEVGRIDLLISKCSLLQAREDGNLPTPLGDETRSFGGVEEGSETVPIHFEDVLRLEVNDTGCGISEDRLGRIFEPFSQAKISDYRKHGGTGLGLSIVARLVEMMGGTIHVKSVVNEGSRFVVYLPVGVVNQVDDFFGLPSNSNLNAKLFPGKAKLRASLKKQALAICDLEADLSESANDSMSTLELSQESSKGHSSFPATSATGDDEDENNEVDSMIQPLIGACVPTTTAKRDTPAVDLLSVPIKKEGAGPARPTHTETKPIPGKVKFHFNTRENVVLVTDDNAMNRKLLGRMLQSFQLETDFACNGLEAVQKVAASRNQTGNPAALHYGLILMDWSMPVMDGCEAVTRIRETNKTIPIVALTAHALQVSQDEAMNAGCNEFATKPIKREDLNKKCEFYLNGESSWC